MSFLFQQLARKFIVPAAAKSGGLRLVFDVEANGLLGTATAVHCIVAADLDGDRVYGYGPKQIIDGLAHLARADDLTGHNIQNYDLPLLHRLHGWIPPAGTKVVDTLVAGRLILPNISDLDDQVAAMRGPKLGKLRGRYSLEAWGVRLGVAKVGAEIEDFTAWTPELQARCVGDVAITTAVWRFLQPDGCSAQAIALEHRVDAICHQIEAAGVPFDDIAAERLERRWSAECAELKVQIGNRFSGMNPNSRPQIAQQLEARGWVPEERTKTGKPSIKGELLETIADIYPEFAGLSRFHLLRSRLATLSKGEKAWRKHIGADGRIHGGIVHIGTPHSRASHAGPNLAQVPNPKRGTPLSVECRALFAAPAGWAFVSADQATLQDRAFAHYLTEFDGGAYAREHLGGVDRHWKNTITLGLVAEGTDRDKQSKLHEVAREGAKGFGYGFLFGAQAKRAGRIINKIVHGMERTDPSCDLRQKFFAGAARPNENALRRVGQRALHEFEAGTPGLQQLRQKLQSHAHRHSWLPGLDGRRVPVRALYSALNFAVTAAEAVVCKRWLVQVHAELCARFRYGWDGSVVIVAWIHDGLACCCQPEIAAEVGEIMVRHAREAGAFYGLKVPLDADFTVGRSWADESAPAGETVETVTVDAVKIATEAVKTATTSAIKIATEAVETDTVSGVKIATEMVENASVDAAAIDANIDDAVIEDADDGEYLPQEDICLTCLDEMRAAAGSPVESVEIMHDDRARAQRESPKFPNDSDEAPNPALAENITADAIPPPWEGVAAFPQSGSNGRGNDPVTDGFDGFTDDVQGYERGKINCPFHDDKTPSCQLYADGHYHCFGCGAHGWIAEDIGELPAEVLARAASAEDDTGTLARGLELWAESKPIAGTLAERYLAETRKLNLALLPDDIGEVLRFHPRCPFGASGARHPCLVALFRDVESDAPAGVHRIGLTKDAKKIKRLTLGRWAGVRAIKLWPAATHKLSIGEGVETVLGAIKAGAITSPAWAMGPKADIASFPILPGVKAISVLVDRGDPAALDGAMQCIKRHVAAGCGARWLRTVRVKDFNDLVMP
jgi:DNA polymerase I-like protein with 3'-5' exonuclease and polymerase domains